MKRQYPLVDLMKFVCAFLVITIHTNPLNAITPIGNFLLSQGLAQIAVPFFFVVAGFFFYQKINKHGHQMAILKQYLLRLLTIYGAWSLIYLPMDLFYPIYQAQQTTSSILITYLKNLLLTGGHFHLWFFPSLIFATILVYLWTSRKKISTLLFLSIFVYLLACLQYGRWNTSSAPENAMLFNLSLTSFILIKNYIIATTFFTLGVYTATLKNIKPKNIFYLTLFAFLYITEQLIIQTIRHTSINLGANVSLFIIPIIYLLFLHVLADKSNQTSLKTQSFREMSILIYCVHGIPLFLFCLFSKSHLLAFLFAAVFSVTSAMIIRKIKLLKLLY